jgi:hypothetical protein
MSFDPNRPAYVQPVGRATTRNRRSGAWHAWQVTLCLFTCGLWIPVYWSKWMKSRSTLTRTTYGR